ncbi:MAG: FtsW/RodA/SpoVE family cell cycle protein [Anaerolineae bacterium]|nr:FtsW/RodA/SpoVE family cell cycle protein [Anaerolineae bacterium]MBT7190143.1 FtsW/RodA/SpoVE family cell cycle protein [Anaerolineae bacterium]MBT7989566.1 FtsW/RodA/SpoVE family cell cycle protein [Anaerolineae bacterium]
MHSKFKILNSYAALFLGLYSLILSLSPALRARSWDVDYRYAHWLGFFTWLFLNWLAEKHLDTKLPDRDPYLFPLASLFSGWGLLTIWRLLPNFGLRQSLWLALSVAVMLLALRWRDILPTLRRYKYILLSSGLLLTALTLVFGANPLNIEPRLWLNFGGIYLQPSELLKLLLVIYLSAYLADRVPLRDKIFPLIFPTLFLGGIALLLLIVQRDLGTASILVMLFASILYIATGRKRVLLGNAIILLTIAFFGYYFSPTIQTRLAIWFSPWDDPSGFGYQIIQSLMAIANGGLWGRGAGIGSPLFVPVAHSDFIFTAIAEETGLTGTLGLLTLFGIFLSRGMVIALRAPNRFQRILASGLTAYLGIQSLLIIGGNLRLLPLTGVTLPFISYGGSSLLTSYLALLLLLKISDESEGVTPPPFLWSTQPYHFLSAMLLLGLITSALINGWWAVVRGPDLLTRSDNPRRAQADFYVPRGSILDRNNAEINITTGESGNYIREYLYPELSSVVGYTNSVYGQAGIEASLDDYLRGLDGNPATLVWWHHLLYGQPPNGLDLRLSLDIDLQENVDDLLSKHKGALVLINAESGEILVMASHPTFNATKFDASLLSDEDSPLLNRATQGSYPLHQTLDTLFDAPPIEIRLPHAEAAEGFASPLQMAMVAAALSNEGIAPAPRLALAVNTSQSGWVILPALGESATLFSAAEAKQLITTFSGDEEAFWQIISMQEDEENLTWLLAGTPSNWSGTPLALAILLEENNPVLAEEIARALLSSAP